MSRSCTRLVAALLSFSAAAWAQAASDIVVIDQGDPAYTVYAGLPGDRADDVNAKIAGERTQVISVKEFADLPARFIGERIVSDEYAGLRAQEGIVELVRKYAGTPFGITWNGGIAYTRLDYQFAKRQFAAYSKDPDDYRRTRNPDSKADPVNPISHLKALLGW